MRLVCVGDKITVSALTIVGAEPVEVQDRSSLLEEVEALLKNKNNIVLISQSVAEEIQNELEMWQKKYSGSIVVVIPDVNKDVEVDVNRLMAEVVGVNFGD